MMARQLVPGPADVRRFAQRPPEPLNGFHVSEGGGQCVGGGAHGVHRVVTGGFGDDSSRLGGRARGFRGCPRIFSHSSGFFRCYPGSLT